MSQVVIENPIINSPFNEPTHHIRFADEWIKNEEVVLRLVGSGGYSTLMKAEQHDISTPTLLRGITVSAGTRPRHLLGTVEGRPGVCAYIKDCPGSTFTLKQVGQ